ALPIFGLIGGDVVPVLPGVPEAPVWVAPKPSLASSAHIERVSGLVDGAPVPFGAVREGQHAPNLGAVFLEALECPHDEPRLGIGRCLVKDDEPVQLGDAVLVLGAEHGCSDVLTIRGGERAHPDKPVAVEQPPTHWPVVAPAGVVVLLDEVPANSTGDLSDGVPRSEERRVGNECSSWGATWQVTQERRHSNA